MAEFISTYQGINYKIPEKEKTYAKFKNGRYVTGDEEEISYLRQHHDYGTTLTEVEKPSRIVGLTPSVIFCKSCDAVFKTQEELDGHVKLKHSFTCKQCGQVFDHPAKLAGHMRNCKNKEVN